jgi:hypothetical protein
MMKCVFFLSLKVLYYSVAHINDFIRLSMVIPICHPCYSQGRDKEDHGRKPAQTKSYGDIISTDKPGMVVYTCQPSLTGVIDGRIVV